MFDSYFDINENLFLKYAREVVEIEISEASRLLINLDRSIVIACRILLSCTGKVIVSGIGKSGHIGKKIASSLASTGTPAFFMHPAEALHGDLGMIGVNDVVVFISYSGCSNEIITLIPLLVDIKVPIVAFTGNLKSPLAIRSSCVLNIAVQKEACPMEIVPTSSMVNALMLGDALTVSLMRYRKFSIAQFAKLHPGGKIGERLLNCVHHVMRIEERISKVSEVVTVMDAMFELNRTGLGLTAVCDKNDYVIGVFTDGDLKRWVMQDKSLKDSITNAMISPGHRIFEESTVSVTLKIFQKFNITAAPVVNKSGCLVGSVNINDLYKSAME